LERSSFKENVCVVVEKLRFYVFLSIYVLSFTSNGNLYFMHPFVAENKKNNNNKKKRINNSQNHSL